MNILSIETSCDETAISIIEADGDLNPPAGGPRFSVLGNNIASQAEIHAKYGGVYPTLAKREHARALVPLLEQTLTEANLITFQKHTKFPENIVKEVEGILEREPELLKLFLEFIPKIEKPDVDAIAVTYGPGLEPALWVGLNFAKALALVWDIQIIPVNHMEGHILSAILAEQKENDKLRITNYEKIRPVDFPAISLLISGGHTELVLIKNWMDYVILGETQDDAVGEAFDKVARMLGLPYPGGPQISRLAEKADGTFNVTLPRPMISSKNYNFSFSGLKTAVLYKIKDIPELTESIKADIANEFQNAVVDVLMKKTKDALKEYDAKTLLLGGGVAANKQIRSACDDLGKDLGVTVLYPRKDLTTDNSIMIGMAGYFRFLGEKDGSVDIPDPHPLRACGTLKL